jgi:hypothetical protein
MHRQLRGARYTTRLGTRRIRAGSGATSSSPVAGCSTSGG